MENFEKLMKKFVYTGVGFVSLSAEKIKTVVEELVDDKKISESEGKKIVKDFFNESEKTQKKYKKKVNKMVKDVAGKMRFAKSDEISKLSKRLEELEKAVAEKLAKK